MKLRTLTLADVPAAGELLLRTNHGQPLAALCADLTDEIERWSAIQIGAFDDGDALVGVVAGHIDARDATTGWSDDIVVERAHHGRRVGHQLIERQLDGFRVLGCRRVCGLSPEAHYGALPFLEAHGFRRAHRLVAQGIWGIRDGEELYVTELLL